VRTLLSRMFDSEIPTTLTSTQIYHKTQEIIIILRVLFVLLKNKDYSYD